MRIIHNFYKLNSSEKIIIIKALFFLWLIRLMLWILPFRIIQKIIKKITVIPEKNKLHTISIEKLIWAVDVMSIYSPKTTCLTRALAARILLSRYHYSSNIRIGISKNKKEFEAHAWLEADERIILGKSEREYIPIHNMGEKTQ